MAAKHLGPRAWLWLPVTFAAGLWGCGGRGVGAAFAEREDGAASANDEAGVAVEASAPASQDASEGSYDGGSQAADNAPAQDAAPDDDAAPIDATTVGTDASVLADGGAVFNEPPCNNADYGTAPWVTETYVDAALPALTGGAIAAGTYYLTSYTVYGPPCVQTSIATKAVVVITPDPANPTAGSLLGATQSQLGQRHDGNATYTSDGGVWVTTSACASPEWSGPQVSAFHYRATPTELVRESPPQDCERSAQIYTKQ